MTSMILAVLQARTGSSRFPGKVLAPLWDKPMLLRQIERLRRASSCAELIVATSRDPGDDALEAVCASEGIRCFRGSLEDVLDRFYQACVPFAPAQVVRLTGDCPLADPEVIDAVVAKHLEEENDYTSNTLEPTFPDGLDVEVLRFSCLEEAWREAVLPSEREHVTPFVHRRPERYRLGNLRREGTDLSGLRWTVDEPEDLDFVSRIYEALYPHNPRFGMKDVLELLRNRPELQEINQGFVRNEGWLKSLQEDALFRRDEEGKA